MVRDRYKKKYDSREKMGTLTFSELKITRLGATPLRQTPHTRLAPLHRSISRSRDAQRIET
jgi:hypothetical protein